MAIMHCLLENGIYLETLSEASGRAFVRAEQMDGNRPEPAKH
jgi:hypothetical protein